MTEDNLPESSTLLAKVIGYFGSAFSIGSALTLTDWGIIVGIVTAIGTFTITVLMTQEKKKLMRERNQREKEEHEVRMKQYMAQGFHLTPEQHHE